jgi:hypothetical protein
MIHFSVAAIFLHKPFKQERFLFAGLIKEESVQTMTSGY